MDGALRRGGQIVRLAKVHAGVDRVGILRGHSPEGIFDDVTDLIEQPIEKIDEENA